MLQKAETIHEAIKAERIRLGLSEADVAEKLGIPRSTYQYWEEKTPSLDKIKRVAVVLGLPEDYFFVKPDENNDDENKAQVRAPLPGSVTLQDLLDEKEKRIKEAQAHLEKSHQEKDKLIDALLNMQRIHEEHLKLMETNLSRGQQELKELVAVQSTFLSQQMNTLYVDLKQSVEGSPVPLSKEGKGLGGKVKEDNNKGKSH